VKRAEETRAVRVETVFHIRDERQGHEVAGRMIDRAHEIANLPDCECDLDVTVMWDPPAPPPAAA
jgi:hypothetical protein